MSSRALSLATVLLLIGFGATDTVLAQATNLEAGKSPSQIFAQTCNACHKSPRGLLKSVAPGSLPGFLRQHYTTSSDMAEALAKVTITAPAAPLVSNVLASAITDPDEIRRRLIEQVTGTVRWRESVAYMAGQGVTRFFEIGAGKVLTGLVKRIADGAVGVAVGGPNDIAAAKDALAAAKQA